MFKNAKLACFLTEEEIAIFQDFHNRREEIITELRAVEDKETALEKEIEETWEKVRNDHKIGGGAFHLDRETWAVLDLTDINPQKETRTVMAALSKEDAEALEVANTQLKQQRYEVKQKARAKMRLWENMSRKYGFDNSLELLLDPITCEVFLDPTDPIEGIMKGMFHR